MIIKDKKIFGRLHEEQNGCEWCHKEGIVHIHHIRPKGMNSGSRLDVGFNLAVLCPDCHAKAHRQAITPEALWAIAAEREVRRLLRMTKEEYAREQAP